MGGCSCAKRMNDLFLGVVVGKFINDSSYSIIEVGTVPIPGNHHTAPKERHCTERHQTHVVDAMRESSELDTSVRPSTRAPECVRRV